MTLAFAADVDDIDLDRSFLSVALDLQSHPFADPDALELFGEIRQPMHRLAVEGDNHIGRAPAIGVRAAQPRALGRRPRYRAHDGDTLGSSARRRCLARGDDPDAWRGHVA